MSPARVTPWSGATPDREQLAARFEAEGLRPHEWSSPPRFEFGWHRHDADQVHYCVAGGITFHTDGGDLEMGAGDRLDLPAGTRHAATVGPEGITMLEADL